MIKEFKTDFSYKNNRQYVHSSTLLENIHNIVTAEFQSGMDIHSLKIDASFHKKIVSNGLISFSEEAKNMKRDKATAATFKIYDENSIVFAKFNEDIPKEVKKRTETNYFIEKLSLNGSFDGSCVIDCSCYPSLIENIIEANKHIHLLTLKDQGEGLEVINLYMKNCPVLLSNGIFKKEIELRITNIAARYGNGSVMTLNSLSFPGVDLKPLEISYIVNGI